MNGFMFLNSGDAIRLLKWDVSMPEYIFDPNDYEYDIRVLKYFTTFDGGLFVYVETYDYYSPARKESITSFLRLPKYSVFGYDHIDGIWRGVGNFDHIEIYDLKVCPFCGSEPTMQHLNGQFGVACGTNDCVLNTTKVRLYTSTYDATNAWNTRYNEKEDGTNEQTV